MPIIKPSSAVLPARYVYTNIAAKKKKSQRVLESDEDTLSAMESEGTLTADDSEKEIDSDSTVFPDGSLKESRHYVFKIKDEVPDSDEDNSSKQQEISTSDTVIKQEPPSDHEGDVYNSLDYQHLISNVRIKEEKDPCITDACDFQTAVAGSQEKVVGNEPVNDVLKSLFVKEHYGSDNSSLKCNHLEPPTTDVDKRSGNESIVSRLSVEDATDKSIKVNYDSNSPPSSREANSVSSSGYGSETCTENMKTPICPSDLQTMNLSVNQIPENSLSLCSSNYNFINVSKEVKHLKANQIGDIPTVNALNTQAIENENDAYLYGGEAQNTDVSFSLFNSAPSVSSTQSPSETADYSEMVSQNSPLCVETKTTVHSCVSSEEKVLTLSENESSARNNISSQKKKICHKDPRRSPPVKGPDNATFDADENCLPRHLIEYSKIYLNFSKSDIEKCLDFVSKKELSSPSIHPIFFGSDRVKVTKSSISPTVSAETVNRPCVKELSSSLFNSENSADVAGMTVEENASVNVDDQKICDPNKCSELPSTEKGDNDRNSKEFSPMTYEVKSCIQSVGTSEQKTNIKCENFKVCDQNMDAEVPSSENNDGFENSNIDFRFARVLSEVTSYEAVMTNKEKSNVKCDSFKVEGQNMPSEVPSSQTGDDEDERFNRIMAEIIRDASKMKTCSESISCKTATHIQPVIENTPIITPAVRNETIPVTKIKQEKMDPMSGTDSQRSDIASTSVQSDLKLFSEESSTLLIPSVEDLQKIIETSTLLNNPLSESKPDPLNLSPKDVKIKVEPPEIEEITLDGDTPLSSNVNRAQPTYHSHPVITDDDIKMLIIKKKKNSYKKTLNRAYNLLTKKKKDNSLQRIANRLSNRSVCNVNTTENTSKKNTVVPNDNFDAVGVSCKSDTFKRAALLHGRKSTKISHSQQNTVDETVSNNILKDIVVKIENTGDYSTQLVPNNSSKETGGTSSSSSKRTVYVLNQPDTSYSYKETPNTQTEPAVKKMRNTPPTHATHEEKPIATNSFTHETNNSCLAGKRKAGDETENMKKIKSEEKEHVKTSFSNCNDEKNLGRAPVPLDRMFPSTVPFRKHTLSYAAVSLPPKANKNISSASDLNSSGAFSNVMYSKVPVSENNCQKPSKSANEISSRDVNIQASKQIENNHAKFQTSSSDRNSSNRMVISTNATCSKVSVYENKNQTPSKLRTEMVSSEADTQPTNSNSEKIQSADVPLIFLDRRGRASLHKSVGKSFMSTNDFPSLILEWNANWLVVQRKGKMYAPICEDTHVKDSYETELEYYNTYFPLHLLSIWLGISESWKNCPPCFVSVFENQVEKPSFVKISLTAVLDTTDFHNWPKREDIVLCNTIKSDGSEENLFGRICNVMAKDYNPPPDSSLKDKASTLKKVKLELFCAELLDVPFLAIVKVQILSNMRIALLQNDALQNLNSSMKDILLDPKKHVSRWKFIALCSSDKFALEKSMKNIFESVISHAVKITVVDTPTPADGICAITQLTIDLIRKRSPVLIGLKNEEAFLKLANSMKRFNPILAIKKREVNLPEELRSFTLEERSVISRDIFQGCHVTLTLLSSVFLGDFTSAFSDQNLTCILHEAHLCTETETALLLYYDVKNLVLFGNQEAQTCVHPLLKTYGYDISLFHRFCRVMSMYASF